VNARFLSRAPAFFLPAAATAVVCVGLAYLLVQQDMRIGANDVPERLAEDAVSALDAGSSPRDVVGATTVDAAASLAPFIAIYDASGTLLATDGSIGGGAPTPPSGVLESATTHGRDAVTWEPQPGVRIATVVIPWRSGTVLAGRSLRFIEERIDAVTRLATLALLAGLVAIGAASLLAAWLWPSPEADPPSSV
jgi:hypothetical protein